MTSLFLRYGLKHHLAHRFRLVMVLLSLALGVATFVSSYESVNAAATAIESSANAFSGKVEWQVSRGDFLGVEESLVDKIRSQKGAIAAPIIEAATVTTGPRPKNFLLFGIDLNSDSTARLLGFAQNIDLTPFIKLRLEGTGIVLTKQFADSEDLKEGGTVSLQTPKGRRTFPIVGVLSVKGLPAVAEGNIGFMEIHDAERQLGNPGTVDRIEVAGISKQELRALCPGCVIERPGKLGSAETDALGRIRSLLGVSVIALLVGLLLIYNTVQVSILERLQDVAILRAVGATRLQIFALLLSEWLIIGLAGSCIGIFIGSCLADLMVEYTKRTVNTMVPLMAQAKVEVSPLIAVAALIIGTGTALVAAFLPVWTAANVRPLEVLRPYTYRRARTYLPAALVGIVLFIVSAVGINNLHGSLTEGLLMVGLEFFSVALLFPQIVIVLGGRLRNRLAGRASFGPFLALDSLLKAPHRTAFTLLTFGCSLMMTVATESLVEGFRASMETWMTSAFPFDISVMGNDLASSVYGSQGLPNSLADSIRRVPGVLSVYTVRKLFTPYKGQDVMAVAVDPDRYLNARSEKSMPMWPPELANDRSRAKFRAGTGVFISSNFGQLYDVRNGAQLHLDTPTGVQSFEVLGQVDDYSWPHGAFIISLHSLESMWKDHVASYIDVSTAPGQDLQDVKARVRLVSTAGQSAFAYDRAEIRQVTNSVLDQTVGMANVQATLAVVIGVLGVVNAIWISVMNRKREIALWRSIGVTRRQVGMIVLYEGLFIATVSAVIGTLGGLYGGWGPLRSFSADMTGYLYPMVVPWTQIAVVTTLSYTLGLLAGALPARQAANLPVLESIGYE